WQLESHKTSGLVDALDKLNFAKSALLVSHGENRNLELASRNIEGVKLSAPNALQPYDVLKHDRLVLSKDAVARLVRSLDPEKKPIEAPHVETIAPAPTTKKEAAPKAEAKKPAAKKAAKPAAKKGKG
ncbi:MAG TPA: 50S ribosomal protein L4, partial [Candidatus Eremiobacteraceae bacterium]|nr:50S ribosomal protein L4 [Candidatus Eremiobacteraceae bacterium]